MENMDQTTGIIFKNLGEHEYRLDNHRDCINAIIENANKAIKNLDWRIKFLGVSVLILDWLLYTNSKETIELKTRVNAAENDIFVLKSEIKELKRAEEE